MKETLHLWFQQLSYEEGFGPSEVPYSEVRKNRINTYLILSVIN